MEQAIAFGSVVFMDDLICAKEREPISNRDVIKICHGNVAQCVNGVPIIQTFKIKIYLSNGQCVVAREDVDIRPMGKNEKTNNLEDTNSRFMASLAFLSSATGLKPQSLTLGVDNFLAGAWSKHKKRLVDLIWLLIFGIPLAFVLIISMQPDFLRGCDQPCDLLIPTRFVWVWVHELEETSTILERSIKTCQIRNI